MHQPWDHPENHYNQEEYDQQEQYRAVGQSEQTNDVTNIVIAIPKSYWQKASQILNIIRQNPNVISWNKQFEFVYNDRFHQR